jgi:uncharacterized protein YbaA (DUF1428 family)
MYIQGFIVPCPESEKQAYKDIAEKFWDIVKDYGAQEHVEAWEADVSDGTHTDFRKAVKLADGEKVVFSWVIWPDKATADAGHGKMMADERMSQFGDDMPFDGKRMIFGGFESIVNEGKPTGGYVDGIIVPVPNSNRDAYIEMAARVAPVFIEHGAVRDLEAWGVDVPVGEVTSFPRSVEAQEDESVVFSFIEWPDEQTRNEGWKKVMEDERMRPGDDMPFDGKRMFWGGFVPLVSKGR